MFRLPLAPHIPMFGFTVFVFLIVCAILAIATFLVFKSGDHGQTKLGGCAGCAIGFALVVIAGLAAAISVGVMVLTTRAELVRNGPFKSFELQFPDRDDDEESLKLPEPRGQSETNPEDRAVAPEGGAERQGNAEGARESPPNSAQSQAGAGKESHHGVHLKLVMRGKEYPAAISEWVREHTDGDVSVTITTQGDRTVVDLELPITRDDLKQFKRDLKQAMPGMKLPKGVKVEIKDADD